MNPSIRRSAATSLLLSAMMAVLFVTPALALGGSNLHRSGAVKNVPDMTIADRVGKVTLRSVLVRKPDGRIRYAAHGYPGRERPTNEPLVGNNVYNATGTGQKATVENFNEFEGAYYIFDISLQNDGNRTDRFMVKATGTASTAWTITYFHGATNITAAVVAGTFRTSSLAPAATYLIRARMTIPMGGQANVARLVTIRSIADLVKIDAVKFAYKAIACGC